MHRPSLLFLIILSTSLPATQSHAQDHVDGPALEMVFGQTFFEEPSVFVPPLLSPIEPQPSQHVQAAVSQWLPVKGQGKLV
jgi:hypothetical protein